MNSGKTMVYKILPAKVYLPKFHIWSAPSRQLWMDRVLVGLLVLSHQIFSVSPEELKCVKIWERWDESRPQHWLLKTLANIYLLYFKTLTTTSRTHNCYNKGRRETICGAYCIVLLFPTGGILRNILSAPDLNQTYLSKLCRLFSKVKNIFSTKFLGGMIRNIF